MYKKKYCAGRRPRVGSGGVWLEVEGELLEEDAFGHSYLLFQKKNPTQKSLLSFRNCHDRNAFVFPKKHNSVKRSVPERSFLVVPIAKFGPFKEPSSSAI